MQQPVRRARFLLAGAAGAAAVPAVRFVTRAAQFEWRSAANQALDHPITIRQAQMWAAVERETGGRVHVQFFPNSALGGDSAMFTQLRAGALQFFMIAPGNLAAVVPVADISFLGFAFRDETEALRVMNGPVGGYIRQECAAKGIYVTRTCWETGMNHVTATPHAIASPDDLRGFKIRIPESRILVDLFRAFSSNPSTISYSEVYTGLQTKLIDGQASALASMEASHIYEVQKYLSLTAHAWTGAWLIANGDLWKSVPADIQDIIERNAARCAALVAGDIKSQAASLTAKLASQGMSVNKVDQAPFRAMLGSYYKAWSDTFGPTAWGMFQTSLGRKLA